MLKKKSHIEKELFAIEKANSYFVDLHVFLEIFSQNEDLIDDEIRVEIKSKLKFLKDFFRDRNISLLFKGKYDKNSAEVEIHAGTGGTEAMDWAEMLLRMYLRYCERKGFKIDILEKLDGEEAGIKKVSFSCEGDFAYGMLKSESGVHRLVRLSPFNANNLRQTSFALVIVTPIIKKENIKLEIKKDEIELQSYRSSGKGGQSVNTTNSAVRLIHKPTGITVSCQVERSFEQNRRRAMDLLLSKLQLLEDEKENEQFLKIRGEVKEGTWSNQIRNYILQPYKLVKDVRTGFESTDPESVLNGEIDGFVESFLLLDKGK